MDVKLSRTRALNKLRETYTIIRESIRHAIYKHEPDFNIKVSEEGTSTSDIINMVANKEAVQLIIMGKFGMGGSLKFNMGTTIKSMLYKTTIPVLVVPPEESWLKLSRIVLPFRLVQGGIEKYEYIREIIHRNKAEVLVAAFSKSDAQSKVKELLAMVKKIKVKIQDDGVATSTKFSVTQTIGWEVNSIARSFYADLVVLNSQIDDDANELYTGVYSRQILDYSKVPILCV